ncbi:MAG: hypothetical protein K0S45_2771 [Nitrospira sp.]|nr:hypothetical protein [Nitrospira sp.]
MYWDNPTQADDSFSSLPSARDMKCEGTEDDHEQVEKSPTFKNEAQGATFWASHDSTASIDYSNSKRMVFPRLKASTETISLRLPKSLLDQLKTLANKRDGPYQTPLKLFVLERVRRSCIPRLPKLRKGNVQSGQPLI